MTKHKEPSHRLRDFLLYIAIGVSIAASVILLGVHLAKTWQKPEAGTKWIGFFILTLLLFWWTIRAYVPFWNNPRFWKFLVAFAVVHLVLGVGTLLRTTRASLLPFMVITPLEYYALSAYLSHFLIPKEEFGERNTNQP